MNDDPIWVLEGADASVPCSHEARDAALHIALCASEHPDTSSGPQGGVGVFKPGQQQTSFSGTSHDCFQQAAQEFVAAFNSRSQQAPSLQLSHLASTTATGLCTTQATATDLYTTYGNADSLANDLDCLLLDSNTVIDSMYLLNEAMFPCMSVTSTHWLAQQSSRLASASEQLCEVTTLYDDTCPVEVLMHELCSSVAVVRPPMGSSASSLSADTAGYLAELLPNPPAKSTTPSCMAFPSAPAMTACPDSESNAEGKLQSDSAVSTPPLTDIEEEKGDTSSKAGRSTRKARDEGLRVKKLPITKSKGQAILSKDDEVAVSPRRGGSASTSIWGCEGATGPGLVMHSSKLDVADDLLPIDSVGSRSRLVSTRGIAPSRSLSSKGRSSKAKVPVAKQRNRSAPSFNEVLRLGLLTPGEYEVLVGNVDTIKVVITEDGQIHTVNAKYSSISAFALSILKQRNPERLACDGWKEVKVNGTKLEVLRQEASRILAASS